MPQLIFEHPLNEQIRTLLRLDHLFEQFEYHLPGHEHWQTRAALRALLDIVSVLARPDLKGELCKLLEQQHASLASIAHNPRVNQTRLQHTLETLQDINRQLQTIGGQIGNGLRKNEFLNSIQQRINIPGGDLEFDLPQLHYWLNLPHETRMAQLRTWQQEIAIVQEATQTILGILRNSTVFHEAHFQRGIFQQSLDAKRPVQLLQVALDAEFGIFPIISGSKHRFCIRFMETTNWEYPQQSLQSLPFRIKTCVL